MIILGVAWVGDVQKMNVRSQKLLTVEGNDLNLKLQVRQRQASKFLVKRNHSLAPVTHSSPTSYSSFSSLSLLKHPDSNGVPTSLFRAAIYLTSS